MKTSVIITTHNEKRDLEVTTTLAAYGSTRPHEVIVVDDYSDDPVGDRLNHIERVKVTRTPRQFGVAASRNYGATFATGDMIVFLDSHMRMPDWWLESIELNSDLHPSAILCPACYAFNYGYGSSFHGCGAKFDEGRVGLEPVWLTPDPDWETEICPCLLGACYAIPRSIWLALRGFNPNFYGWGQDEQDISIRAWISGYEVRRINRLTVDHRWDRDAILDNDPSRSAKDTWQENLSEEQRIDVCPEGNFMNSWQPGFNSVVTCATIFEDEKFFDRYRKTLVKEYPNSKIWHRFYEHEDNIKSFRTWVQDHRVRSDAEIERIIGPFIPEVKQ